MRLFIAVILVLVVPMTLREMAVPASASESAERTGALYDPNPAHIWNRLYATLLVRKDRRGASYAANSLDPPRFFETEHLLEGATNASALHLLDELLQTHAENLIRSREACLFAPGFMDSV
jgi:hypothetical protein